MYIVPLSSPPSLASSRAPLHAASSTDAYPFFTPPYFSCTISFSNPFSLRRSATCTSSSECCASSARMLRSTFSTCAFFLARKRAAGVSSVHDVYSGSHAGAHADGAESGEAGKRMLIRMTVALAVHRSALGRYSWTKILRRDI